VGTCPQAAALTGASAEQLSQSEARLCWLSARCGNGNNVNECRRGTHRDAAQSQLQLLTPQVTAALIVVVQACSMVCLVTCQHVVPNWHAYIVVCMGTCTRLLHQLRHATHGTRVTFCRQ